MMTITVTSPTSMVLAIGMLLEVIRLDKMSDLSLVVMSE